MRLLFAGTSAIGESTLRMLLAEHEVVGVLTQPDRPAGRHRHLTPPPIKTVAQALAPVVPLFQPETLRDPSLQAALQALNPDVMVTFSYGKIIPPALLALPKIASLNVHASLLPKYRGASPIQAAIMAGDQESGITIMYMDEGLDTGDLLLSKELSLAPRETTATLSARLAALAPEALQEALLLLEKGTAPRAPQENTLATHTHRITRADAALDWSYAANELERLIRAMNPKPGAHGTVFFAESGKKIPLKIFSARVMENSLPVASEHSLPSNLFGSFVNLETKEPLLLCGEGALLLEEVQPEGGSKMSFEAFLRGHQMG